MHDVFQYKQGLFWVVLQDSTVVLLPPLPQFLTKTPENFKQNLEQALFYATVAIVIPTRTENSHTHTNINFYLQLVSLVIFPAYQNHYDSSPRIYKDEDSQWCIPSLPARPHHDDHYRGILWGLDILDLLYSS